MPNPATRLESEDDVRRALAAYRPDAVTQPFNPARPAPADDAPPLFRPSLRPPTPLLVVCDDGVATGQSIRVRQENFVIGRTEGDLIIPHDGQMSSRHAVLERKSVKGKTQWSLVDLKSTNGTYVRVSNALLEDGSEFIIGRTRFRFEKPPTAAASATRPDEQKTQLWQQPATGDAAPALVELTNDGPGRRLLVNHPETWIGKDTARCQMVLSADPFASARHARIRQDDEGRWVLENNKSINGVWFKVPQIVIKNSCRFMLGEQQFAVQLPK